MATETEKDIDGCKRRLSRKNDEMIERIAKGLNISNDKALNFILDSISEVQVNVIIRFKIGLSSSVPVEQKRLSVAPIKRFNDFRF
jgi:hypothetical protein